MLRIPLQKIIVLARVHFPDRHKTLPTPEIPSCKQKYFIVILGQCRIFDEILFFLQAVDISIRKGALKMAGCPVLSRDWRKVGQERVSDTQVIDDVNVGARKIAKEPDMVENINFAVAAS